MIPLSIIGDLSNVHFYEPHIKIVQEQLGRAVNQYQGCYLTFSDKYTSLLEDFKAERISFDEFLKRLDHTDFIFNDYNSFPALKGDMFAPTE